MSLVVKKWYADARPNENGSYVEILARNSGVVGWLFTLIGIDDTHYLGVFFNKIILQESSLGGSKKIIVPIDSVSFTYFHFKKPWKKALILFLALVIFSKYLGSSGILVDIGGALGTLAIDSSVIVLVGSFVVASIYYFLNKQLAIVNSEQSGKNLGLYSLKRSLIEGEGVTVERLDLATKIIITLIDQHKLQHSSNVGQENQIS